MLDLISGNGRFRSTNTDTGCSSSNLGDSFSPFAQTLKRVGSGVALLILLHAVPVFGTTFTVTNTNDSGPGSLRDAIANAAHYDTINFSLALPATINLDAPLELHTRVTISGPGAAYLAISGQNNIPVLLNYTDYPGVHISGITVEFGSYPWGGCIFNGGSLTLTDTVVSRCTEFTRFGGGVFNSGELFLIGSTVSGNAAGNNSNSGYGGGIYNTSGANTGVVILTKSAVSGNFASTEGGGIYTSGHLIVTNSTISGNSANTVFGGISNHSLMEDTNSTI